MAYSFLFLSIFHFFWQNFLRHLKQLIRNERGEWVGNIIWLAVYGLAAIVVALAVVAGITALQGRVVTDINTVNP